MSDPLKHFIDRLERAELYGKPADGLLQELMKRCHGVTYDHADAAAETIIRTHGSGAFPKYPACEKALREAAQGRSMKVEHVGASSGITRANYTEHVQKWNGRFGTGYLVLSRDQVAQWETWREYFRIKGFPFDYEALSHPTRQQWTVPTPWPDMFDREAPLPMTDDEARRARQPAGQFRADGAIERVRDSMEDFRRDIPRRRREERVKRQHIDETAFERWAEDAKSQPTPSPSSELIQRMNPEPRKDAA